MSATATGLDSKAKEPEADSLKATESGEPVVDAPTANEGRVGLLLHPLLRMQAAPTARLRHAQLLLPSSKMIVAGGWRPEWRAWRP